MDELKHYGVKGMRWGIRKDRKSSGKHKGSSKSKKFKLSAKQKKYLLIGAAWCGSIAFSYFWATKLSNIASQKLYKASLKKTDWDTIINNSGPEIVRRI